MHFQFLDNLRSQDDRAALASAVGRELCAPMDLARVYGRLVSESIHAQTRQTGPGLDLEKAIARANADQVHWLGGVFRQEFLSRAIRMLDWAHRLKLSQSSQEWSPHDWVAAAGEIEAESELLCLVIEKADTLTWPVWNQAFANRGAWPAQWMGWEQAFARSPGLASRWLESLLLSDSSEDPTQNENRADHLSFSRGRLWQKIHASQAAGRPTELLNKLDARLACVGARRRLECVDYTAFLRKEGKLVSPAQAKASLHDFFSSSPDSARDWLSGLCKANEQPMVLGVDKADLRGLAALSWLASQGACTSGRVQAVFNHWATLLDDADWEHVFDAKFLASFGVTIPDRKNATPAQVNEDSRKSAARKGPKAKAKKPSSVAAPAPPVSASPTFPTAPVTLSPEPLPAIPRFAKRK